MIKYLRDRASKRLIHRMINKHSIEQRITSTGELIRPKVEWSMWGNNAPASTQPASFKFNFEGKFLKNLTTTEGKVLALHEIAHYNALLGHGRGFEHGEPMQELGFYGIFKKEKISYDQVNTALSNINKKWKAFK